MTGWTERSAVLACREALARLSRVDPRAHEAVDKALLRESHVRARETLCTDEHCCRPAVASHVLARSVTLGPLTENGHLVMPRAKNGRIDYPRVGWKRASTFPGFCSHHEQMFHVFESAGSLSTPLHHQLQMFRSATRERWRIERSLSDFQAIETLRMEQIDGLDVSDDEREQLKNALEGPLSALRSMADIQWSYMVHVRNDLRAAINAGRVSKGLLAFSDRVEPNVALSGNTVLTVNGRASPLVFVTMPNAGQRLFLIATLEEEHHWLDGYRRRFASTAETRTDLIRAFQMATDHWFARISWWDSQSHEARSQLSAGLLAI